MKISKLNHRNLRQAMQIWRLFQSAYKIEAEMLNIHEFPPLDRTVQHIQQANTTFFGGWHGSDLVAATEIETIGPTQIHINSLGVSPDYFRRGFGAQLLNDVLAELSWQLVTVSTAVANNPALQLYTKLGFQPQDQWSTPDHIHMVTLYKETEN